MFQRETWDILVRKYGVKASGMGPLTLGTREEGDGDISDGRLERLWKREHGKDIGPDSFNPIALDDGMTEARKKFITSENARKVVAARIYNALVAEKDISQKREAQERRLRKRRFSKRRSRTRRLKLLTTILKMVMKTILKTVLKTVLKTLQMTIPILQKKILMKRRLKRRRTIVRDGTRSKNSYALIMALRS
jgi:hypothetical protein